jgi:LPXTG-motif cell wall-anchored protein
LAAPPTVPAPTQADDGAQLYWLNCQPCHGDVGQGLTDAADDDWRAQYPLDDQYCWNSGCHGAKPYEDGFTLPKQVPALIGEATLSRFVTAADLYDYVRVAMPRQAPSTLSDGEYLSIVAYLVDAHAVWDGLPLTVVSAQNIILNEPEPTVTAVPAAIVIATVVPPPTPTSPPKETLWLVVAGLAILLSLGGIVWLKQRR